MERLPGPEREAIAQICQAHDVSRVSRFWWTIGAPSQPGTVVHPSSKQTFPVRRDVLTSLVDGDIIYFFPGCDADDDAFQFGLSDLGFDICAELREGS